MARIKFLKNKQSCFLRDIKERNGLTWSDVARICGVKDRTLFDWRRDKYQMSYESFKEMSSKFKNGSNKIEILPDSWNIIEAGRLGAYARNKIYGPPGTASGRRNGGLTTTTKFRNNPTLAKELGFIIKKSIRIPDRSYELAEFIGIVLGDGSIDKYQIRITTNATTDKDYSEYIKTLSESLFDIKSVKIRLRKSDAVDIIISSKSVVDFLIKCGMKKGNKIRNQVDIPFWISKDIQLSKWCLRGLMDTDGGIFFHRHKTKGIPYRNIGLCFTNHSKPLLNSFYKILLDLNINAKSDRVRHVYIYGINEISKYMKIVGSSNTKHINRFDSYEGSKS